ncbi:hypothetical protein BJ741DRAFT_639203 [Chytriomyces cf. hyalinus JEL632]|nr:hypothetical protein BJ741DRAFT_639763 [Chytriomyces cf. hyalinus JEL632]KAI8820325.1 hypothetical protein BJ741DRAFT_639203 [Chytriomyces cf. hyalinus JEL632]
MSASLASLSAHLPRLSASRHSTIVVTDTLRSDAFPCLHHTVADSLALESTLTLLVCVSTQLSHFETVAKKMGYSIARNKQFTAIDAFPHIASIHSKNPSGPFTSIPGNPLRSLLETIQNTFSAAKSKDPSLRQCNLILDPVSEWVSLGERVEDVAQFVGECRAFVVREGGSLAVFAHEDVETREHAFLVNFLLDMADFTVRARGLESGFTDSATGQITIHSRPTATSPATGVESKQLLYHVSESGVKVWVPGN